MQGKPIPDLKSEDDEMDFMVLDTILEECAGLWSIAEIGRTLGNPVGVEDSINRLYGWGLVHKLGEFIFPTRAAAHSHSLPRL